MLKHIVLWKLKETAEGNTKEENMILAKDKLLALPTSIYQIKSLTVGSDVLHGDKSFDMGLVADFDSLEDMKLYQVHPDHVAVASFIGKITADRATLDFEF